MRDRPSTACLAYIAGELGTPISQSRILLSATRSAGPVGACVCGLSASGEREREFVVVVVGGLHTHTHTTNTHTHTHTCIYT